MKTMFRTRKFSAFAFTTLLIASILCSMFSAVPILIKPVYATPDPVTNTHHWYSQPTQHTTTLITVTNPANARDKNNATTARFNYGAAQAGSFDLRTFGTQLVRDPPLPVIKQVDIKMIYGADQNTAGQTYRIEYQVGSSLFQTLVDNTGEAHSNATATVWANQPEPIDAVWDWTDIGNVRLRVAVSGGAGTQTTYFWEAEGWLTIVMEDSPRMFMDPANITDTGKTIGTTFTVDVRMDNISDASGVQFRLRYDPSILQSNPQWVMGNLFGSPFVFENETDNVEGEIVIAFSRAPLTQTSFGSARLVTFTFSVVGRGETTLNLHTTLSSDSNADDILHDVEDGYFRNVAMPYGATIKVIAPTQDLNRSFTVTVNITKSVGESGAFGVYNYEFNMTYDNTRLNATSVALGSFMGPSSTVTFQRVINYAEGWVWVNVTRKLDQVAGFKPPGAWGNGTLATIGFDIINSGVATMGFSEAKLIRFDYGLGDMDTPSNPLPSKNPFSDLPASTVGGQVTMSKIPPRARFSFSPSQPLPLQDIVFNASASSDVDGTIVSWSWNFGDGGNGVGEVVTHNYTLPSAYSVQLTVTDNDTLTGTLSTIVNVLEHDVAVPSISLSPDRTIVPGEIVTILVILTNQGDFNETVDVNVYFDNVQAAATRHIVDLTPSASLPLTFEWNTTGVLRGTYTVKGNVTVVPDESDVLDNESIDTVKLSQMVAPVASFVFSPSVPKVAESVAFDASGSSDPDGGVINRYDWTFGDGSSARYFGGNLSQTSAHAYTVAGTYNVTLTIRDDDNLLGRFSLLVTVKDESAITIAAAPNPVPFSGVVVVSGAITPTRAGVSVSIYWRLQGSTAWTLLVAVPTGATSSYSYSWTPSQVAVYQLKGNWTGDSLTLGAESSVLTVTVNKVSSEVSVNLSVSELTVGDSVTISGSIVPSRSGASVILEFRATGTTAWTEVDTVATNANGQYSYEWTPEVGDFEVRARWDGDVNTNGDTSTVASLVVEEVPSGGGLPIPLYAIVIIVIAVVVAVVGVYFLRFRKK